MNDEMITFNSNNYSDVPRTHILNDFADI